MFVLKLLDLIIAKAAGRVGISIEEEPVPPSGVVIGLFVLVGSIL